MAEPSEVRSLRTMVRVLGQLARKVLLDLLTNPDVRVIEHVSNEVNAASFDREYLVILFDLQFQICHIQLDLGKGPMQLFLV